MGASEIYPRRLNAKEVLIAQKDGEFVFPVSDGSATLSGRDYEFQEPTLRREHTVRRENLSGESQGDGEEFQPGETKDDAETQEDFWSAQGDYLLSSFLNREVEPTCREKNHSLFHKNYIIERNSSEKKYTMRREDWRKAKTSGEKQIQLE